MAKVISFDTKPFQGSSLTYTDKPPYVYHFTNTSYYDAFCTFTFLHMNTQISTVGDGVRVVSVSDTETTIEVIIPPASKDIFLAEGHVVDKLKSYSIGVQTKLFSGNPFAVHDDSYHYLVPFSLPSIRVGQTFGGTVSHYGDKHHSVDFAAEIGTEIVAAREGYVCMVKDDSNISGKTRDFIPHANAVVIRHDDGTFGNYGHLMYQGSRVSVGEYVQRGQLIALSGDTGWNPNLPHLHFDICKIDSPDNLAFVTVPYVFYNGTDEGFVPSENCIINLETYEIEEMKPVVTTTRTVTKTNSLSLFGIIPLGSESSTTTQTTSNAPPPRVQASPARPPPPKSSLTGTPTRPPPPVQTTPSPAPRYDSPSTTKHSMPSATLYESKTSKVTIRPGFLTRALITGVQEANEKYKKEYVRPSVAPPPKTPVTLPPPPKLTQVEDWENEYEKPPSPEKVVSRPPPPISKRPTSVSPSEEYVKPPSPREQVVSKPPPPISKRMPSPSTEYVKPPSPRGDQPVTRPPPPISKREDSPKLPLPRREPVVEEVKPKMPTPTEDKPTHARRPSQIGAFSYLSSSQVKPPSPREESDTQVKPPVQRKSSITSKIEALSASQRKLEEPSIQPSPTAGTSLPPKPTLPKSRTEDVKESPTAGVPKPALPSTRSRGSIMKVETNSSPSTEKVLPPPPSVEAKVLPPPPKTTTSLPPPPSRVNLPPPPTRKQ